VIYQQQRLFAGLPIYALNRCHELDMPGSTDKDVQIMQWHLQGNDSQHCATYESRLANANSGRKRLPEGCDITQTSAH
jgi:hypothetical protein